MINSFLADMFIDAMVKNMIVKEEQRENIKAVMYEASKDMIFSTWSVDDIIDKAEMRNKRVSRKSARAILDNLEDRFDASIGINWDVIDEYI